MVRSIAAMSSSAPQFGTPRQRSDPSFRKHRGHKYHPEHLDVSDYERESPEPFGRPRRRAMPTRSPARLNAHKGVGSPSVYAQARMQLEHSAAQDAIAAAKRTRDKRKAKRMRDIRDQFSELTAPSPATMSRATALVHGGGYGAAAATAQPPRLDEGRAGRFRPHPSYYQTGAGSSEAALLSVRAGHAVDGPSRLAALRTENIFEDGAGHGADKPRRSEKGNNRTTLQSTWADPGVVGQTVASRVARHVQQRRPAAMTRHTDSTFLTSVEEFDRFQGFTGNASSLQRGDDVPPSLIPQRFYEEAEGPVYSALGGNGDVDYDPATGNWRRPVFPTARPSNRNEVFHLAKTLDNMLRVRASWGVASVGSHGHPGCLLWCRKFTGWTRPWTSAIHQYSPRTLPFRGNSLRSLTAMGVPRRGWAVFIAAVAGMHTLTLP